MAGIDILNQFPNSKMAQAVRLGQSRFNSPDASPVVTGLKSGGATMAPLTGTTSTATLMSLAGLSSSFYTMVINVVSSAAGVTIAQTGGATKTYYQGQSATFNNVSTSANQITVLTNSADVVTINYIGV